MVSDCLSEGGRTEAPAQLHYFCFLLRDKPQKNAAFHLFPLPLKKSLTLEQIMLDLLVFLSGAGSTRQYFTLFAFESQPDAE